MDPGWFSSQPLATPLLLGMNLPCGLSRWLQFAGRFAPARPLFLKCGSEIRPLRIVNAADLLEEAVFRRQGGKGEYPPVYL